MDRGVNESVGKCSCCIPNKQFYYPSVDAPIDERIRKEEKDFADVLNKILLNDKTAYIEQMERVKKENRNFHCTYLYLKSVKSRPAMIPEREFVDWKCCERSLNKKDKEFLLAKPNYSEVGRKLDELTCQMAALLSAKHSSRKLVYDTLKEPKLKVDRLKFCIGRYLEKYKKSTNTD